MENQEFSKTPNIIEEGFGSSLVTDLIERVDKKKSLRDILLNDEDFEEAEVFYPSKMNMKEISENSEKPDTIENVQAFFMSESEQDHPQSPFILANTLDSNLEHLRNACIIPVFSKDNEKTIAHQEFIDVVLEAIHKAFPMHSITTPEIRVSHQVKGRVPEAIHKNAKDLLENEKTIYYERMAFIVRIPSIRDTINGNELSLTLGGVRSYNLENLYNKKSFEKFKFFIGFQNKVCCNLCVTTDGFLAELKVTNTIDLYSRILETIQNYNAELHLMEMKELTQDFLTEHQFAQLIGRSRLYQHLPKLEKLKIPLLNFNDSHINTIAKDYYEDHNFSRQQDGTINLWDVYNLFTQANKSSYIDTFLDRDLNAFEVSKGLQKTLNGNSKYHWFLS